MFIDLNKKKTLSNSGPDDGDISCCRLVGRLLNIAGGNMVTCTIFYNRLLYMF